jgi:hypothetical protein
MIRINKGECPCELAKANYLLSITMLSEFEAHSQEFIAGKRTFSNFSDAYKSEAVKKALIACQFNKCCFSEAKFVGDYSDVEHFRPKGKVDSWPDGQTEYPGYYWLAYDWKNLFLCKKRINTSEKRNFFPLYCYTPRNKFHFSTHEEQPILIDVSIEDPREHIRFRNSQPVPITERGRFNIDFFNLRHPEFVEARREKFQLMKGIKDLVDKGLLEGKDKNEYKNEIELLRSKMNPSSEFSSMAIDFLKDWPPLQ